MGENGLSVADALALGGRNNGTTNNGDAWGNNSSWWIIVIILFFAFGGWGRNGYGNGNGDNGGTNTVIVPTGNGGIFGNNGYNWCCTPATQQGVTDAFNFNQLDNGVRSVQNGLCDGFYTTSLNISNLGNTVQQGFCASDRANLQSFNATQNAISQSGYATQSAISQGAYDTQTAINNGTTAIQSSLCNGFNSLTSDLAQTNYNMQNCCCETRESIMNSNFANQSNANAIQTQIANSTCELSRGQENIKYALAQAACDITANADKNADRIINHMIQNEMDSLRTELQSAQFQLSQNAQTNNIINQLLPVARPAYLTASPFASAMGVTPYANTGCC